MYAWTTQGFVVTVEGEDLSDANVSVTFKQFRKSGSVRANVTITDPTVEVSGEDTIVTCALSQAQSGLFGKGKAQAQINAVWSGNIRRASDWMEFDVEENLRDREVTYA